MTEPVIVTETDIGIAPERPVLGDTVEVAAGEVTVFDGQVWICPTSPLPPDPPMLPSPSPSDLQILD